MSPMIPITKTNRGELPGWANALLLAIGAALAARLFHKAWIASTDFAVYWNAVHSWLDSRVSPYYFDAAARGFVFKYPPWILPVFLPFAFIGHSASAMIWAALELFCMAYSIGWVIRRGIRPLTAYVVALLYWWIWQNHFYYGQVTIVLLAIALLAQERDTALRTSFLGIAFTSKIFSVVTLLGVWRRFLRLRVWATMLGVSAALTAAVLAVMWHNGANETLPGLYREWLKAASSGGSELGARVVRGQLNHGFTAGVLRWCGVDSRRFMLDAAVSLGLTALFGALWMRFSKGLEEWETWLGWIALGLIVHPLAWDHSFVLAYPFSALALDRAISSRSRPLIALAALGICCIGVFVPSVIGTEWVKPLEYFASKSWGVLFSAVALVRARKLRDGSMAPIGSTGAGPLCPVLGETL